MRNRTGGKKNAPPDDAGGGEDGGKRMEERGWRIEDGGWRMDVKLDPSSILHPPSSPPLAPREICPPPVIALPRAAGAG
jgi:hypothetical protein